MTRHNEKGTVTRMRSTERAVNRNAVNPSWLESSGKEPITLKNRIGLRRSRIKSTLIIIISIIVINHGFIFRSLRPIGPLTLRPFTRYQKLTISDAPAIIFSPDTAPCFFAKFRRLLLNSQLCAFLFVYQRRHLKSRAFQHCWH